MLEFDPITFGLLGYDIDCNDLGSIEVVDLNGGNGDFQFSIDGEAFQDVGLFFDLTAQDYQVWVNDFFDCGSTQNIALVENYGLMLELPQVDAIQQGQSTYLNPLINENTIDSFSWSPSHGILNPGQIIAQVSPQQSTEYSLTIYFW